MTCPSSTASSLALTLLVCATSALHAAQPPVFEVSALALPAMDSGAQPDLVGSANGSLFLSWTEKLDTGHRLRFSRLLEAEEGDTNAEDRWLPAQTIASGDDWFVNWADTPHLVAFGDGTLWAHWLRKNGTAIYDYGVALVHSGDQGQTWSAPIRLEPEGARLDYGFVSLWEQHEGVLGIGWLDSRQKQPPHEGHDEHHDHGGGAMMLRAATFDAAGVRTGDWALDTATCDCCPTSVAMTSDGAVLAYRGRTTEEVRDIQLVRLDGRAWSQPVTVHADNWIFAGCPVNGPAVVASGKQVWVAWYTEGGGQPAVRIARSRDAGRKFDSPLQVAQGKAQLGRVDMAMDANNVWLTWLVESSKDNAQQLMLARIDAKSGTLMQRGVVADIAAKGRASGLPQIQVQEGDAWLVWTDSVDGKLRLRGAKVRSNNKAATPGPSTKSAP
ncbi:hypothetical protein [Dokdonella sp.]|uniref:hypothetical protein n=1 Tax=Dokdonella sp. TaxID=2291710 RepID=UPI003C467660